MDTAEDWAGRASFRLAATAFVDLVAQVGPAQWAQPALGVWTARDLVGHTARAMLTVENYLDPGVRTAEPELVDAVAYIRAGTASGLADPDAVAERGRQAGAALGDDPAATVAEMAHRVLDLVERSPDDALVRTPVGTLTLAGYLPGRTFELVSHGLDLANALDLTVPESLTAPLSAALGLATELAAAHGDAALVLRALTGRDQLPAGYTVL